MGTRNRDIVGEVRWTSFKKFKVDIALTGISGIEADGSLRDYDYSEVKVFQAIIHHVHKVWLATDSSKFNRPAMVEIGGLSQIDRLFTDALPPQLFPNYWQRRKCARE